MMDDDRPDLGLETRKQFVLLRLEIYDSLLFQGSYVLIGFKGLLKCCCLRILPESIYFVRLD